MNEQSHAFPHRRLRAGGHHPAGRADHDVGSFPHVLCKGYDNYTIVFDDATGVATGTPVRRSGIRIGEVKTWSSTKRRQGASLIGVDQQATALQHGRAPAGARRAGRRHDHRLRLAAAEPRSAVRPPGGCTVPRCRLSKPRPSAPAERQPAAASHSPSCRPRTRSTRSPARRRGRSPAG